MEGIVGARLGCRRRVGARLVDVTFRCGAGWEGAWLRVAVGATRSARGKLRRATGRGSSSWARRAGVAGGSRCTVWQAAHREGVPVEDDVLDELLVAPPHLGQQVGMRGVARRKDNTRTMRPWRCVHAHDHPSTSAFDAQLCSFGVRLGKAGLVRRTRTHYAPPYRCCTVFGCHGRQRYQCITRVCHTHCNPHLGRPEKELLVLVFAQDIVHVELDACRCGPTCTVFRNPVADAL